eukprot:scaffold6444_cov79-Isochrysis_galbana.AAC.2
MAALGALAVADRPIPTRELRLTNLLSAAVLADAAEYEECVEDIKGAVEEHGAVAAFHCPKEVCGGRGGPPVPQTSAPKANKTPGVYLCEAPPSHTHTAMHLLLFTPSPPFTPPLHTPSGRARCGHVLLFTHTPSTTPLFTHPSSHPFRASPMRAPASSATSRSRRPSRPTKHSTGATLTATPFTHPSSRPEPFWDEHPSRSRDQHSAPAGAATKLRQHSTSSRTEPYRDAPRRNSRPRGRDETAGGSIGARR